MEIVGPVLGIGSIILFIVGGVVLMKWATARIARHELQSGGIPNERDQILEEVCCGLGSSSS
jgi:hypothetical protein